MKVLVTGGVGFIGSHLVRLLLDRGYSVTVLDNLSQGKLSNLDQRAQFIEGDVSVYSDCLIAAEGAEVIFHMAAMSRSGPSMSQTDTCIKSNIVGTKNILEAAEKLGVNKLIYSASSTCYGNSPIPHTLETDIDLLNPYGWSKYAGEQLALTFAKTNNLDVISLRYFNVYGNGEPTDGPYALVMGIFINNFINQRTLEIHGSGDQVRDFIHVSDVAEANYKAMISPVTFGSFNVGSGKAYSIKQLADFISPNQKHIERRSGDSEGTLADISKTVDVLGWAPQIDIQRGLKQSIEHYSSIAL